MICPECGEYMDESLDDGGVDYADEYAIIYCCPVCGYEEVCGWGYFEGDAAEYPVAVDPSPDTSASPDDDIPF